MLYLVEAHPSIEKGNAVDWEKGLVPWLPKSWSGSGRRRFTAIRHAAKFSWWWISTLRRRWRS